MVVMATVLQYRCEQTKMLIREIYTENWRRVKRIRILTKLNSEVQMTNSRGSHEHPVHLFKLNRVGSHSSE